MKKIYVYDRLNRVIHECDVVKEEHGWLHFTYGETEGKYNTKWEDGSVQLFYRSSAPDNMALLVSTNVGSLNCIKHSDGYVFDFLRMQLQASITKALRILKP